MSLSERIKVKLRIINKYTHYLRIPADLFKQLPETLNKEFELELVKVDLKNPLTWEIRVKPPPELLHQQVESAGKGKSHKEPA